MSRGVRTAQQGYGRARVECCGQMWQSAASHTLDTLPIDPHSPKGAHTHTAALYTTQPLIQPLSHVRAASAFALPPPSQHSSTRTPVTSTTHTTLSYLLLPPPLRSPPSRPPPNTHPILSYSAPCSPPQLLPQHSHPRSHTPPHSSMLTPGTSTTRTTSSYFSPNMAVAPPAFASVRPITRVCVSRAEQRQDRT